MRMELPAENQICSSSSSSSSTSSLCFFRHHSLYVAVLVLFLVSTSLFSTYLFTTSSVLFITVTLLILSTFLVFKFTTQKVGLEENLLKDEMILSSIQKNSFHPEVEEVFKEPPQQLQNEVFLSKKETQVGVPQQLVHYDYVLSKSSDLSSETESVDISSSSEDSDVEWPFRKEMGEFTMFSDDSISDDESLIEIDLPGGHYISAKEEPKLKFEETLKEFLKEPIFNQQSLMELLAEINNDMNEEENLIEIDISMGSIKCSRFEIEA